MILQYQDPKVLRPLMRKAKCVQTLCSWYHKIVKLKKFFLHL